MPPFWRSVEVINMTIIEVIEILNMYDMDNIRALTAVLAVVKRMGYDIVDGEIIEHNHCID